MPHEPLLERFMPVSDPVRHRRCAAVDDVLSRGAHLFVDHTSVKRCIIRKLYVVPPLLMYILHLRLKLISICLRADALHLASNRPSTTTLFSHTVYVCSSANMWPFSTTLLSTMASEMVRVIDPWMGWAGQIGSTSSLVLGKRGKLHVACNSHHRASISHLASAPPHASTTWRTT